MIYDVKTHEEAEVKDETGNKENVSGAESETEDDKKE